jgi:hypothetical protein
MSGSGSAGGAADEVAARPTARVDIAEGFFLQTRDEARIRGTDCLALKEFFMSVRLGRRGLVRLRDQLSDRDRLVIHSIASHRFLTGKQVERFHFEDHATDETGARVCRQVLARLTRQRVVGRLQRRVGGVRAGSGSYVYTLGPVGRRLVGEEVARQVREPSATFLTHTLAIAEEHLALLEASRDGRFELVIVEIEPACWRRYIGAGGAREVVRPDLYVVSARDEFEYCWFLEIDLGTEHKPALVRKCRAYDAYWRSGLEQQRSRTFPLVVWAAPDERRARQIEQAIRSARSLKQGLFRVVPASALVDLFAEGAA